MSILLQPKTSKFTHSPRHNSKHTDSQTLEERYYKTLCIDSFNYLLLFCNSKPNSIPYHTKTLLTSDQPLHSQRTDQFWLGLYSPNKLRPSRSSEYSDTTPFIIHSWNQLLFLSFVLDVNVSCPQDRSWALTTPEHQIALRTSTAPKIKLTFSWLPPNHVLQSFLL
jgi:hypothetical protein